MPSRPRQRRWLRRLGVVGVLLVLAAGGAALLLRSSEPGDVTNTDVPFDAAPAPVPSPTPAAKRPGRPSSFAWPVYGYTAQRTRFLPLAKPLRPPFAERWKVSGSVLLEFPPVMAGRSLYLLKNNAAMYGIDRKSGKVRWKRKLGNLAASSPAYANGTLYVVLLQRGKGIDAGRVLALRAKDGSTRWSRKLPSRAESSPLVIDGSVYFGSEDGTVYGLRARDGYVRWRTKVGGAVKGGLALGGDKLFFGDYAGEVHALRLTTGRQVWTSKTSGGRFGLRAGNFYATAAVAYGRVYLGNTDGFVYSFSARDGSLAWRKKTGGYVYGSPAVAQLPGGPPTVYIGSYDKHLYALDARTGRVRWSHAAEGRISGGAVVLGDLVFYSTLARTTTAVGAQTGQRVWSTHRGAFNPVVSDGRGIFLLGMTNLYGLDGRPPKARPAGAEPGSTLSAAARKRFVGRRYARRQAAIGRRVALRRRALARRVAARRAAVARRNDMRRRGERVCFRAHGKRTCALPRPLVCVQAGERTVCRARRRG
jgi:outer membrane protein assembly factor BamB